MIYFDSASTTLQKPPAVAEAAATAIRRLASPGRGGYHAADQAAEIAFQCRAELAALFRVPSPECVVFTGSATHSLNIAIKTLVKSGSKVVISGYEHNAVTRPLHAIGKVNIAVADAPLFQPDRVLDAFARRIRTDTDAVICNHVSNVFGFVQPVEEIAALCHRRRIPLIIDASQSAGILPLDFQVLGAAFIAMPGHKGLYGPQGTGVLLCGEGIRPRTLLEGGTGSRSIDQTMPDFLPDRLESGTHNMPGIAGLLEGVRYVRRLGSERICAHERKLALALVNALQNLPDFEVFAQPDLSAQVGVVSFRSKRVSPEEMGNRLAARDIAVRCGLHCSPFAHRTAGTLETGTVRASFSAFNRMEELKTFVSAVQQVSR